MKITTFLLAIIPFIIGCDDNVDKVPPSLMDNDGNSFDTVKIGTQTWMQQNLNSSHYRNGDLIPEVTDFAIWSSLETGAWSWYNNDSATYAAVYGKLYNWFAVKDPRGLAPEGWHIPSDQEFADLRTQLGVNAGGELKETGTIHWAPPNTSATNNTGFTGLPGGSRYLNLFEGINGMGGWWSTTEDDDLYAWYGHLYYASAGFERKRFFKGNGLSVKCILDE